MGLYYGFVLHVREPNNGQHGRHFEACRGRFLFENIYRYISLLSHYLDRFTFVQNS